jgi:hypothetical protein
MFTGHTRPVEFFLNCQKSADATVTKLKQSIPTSAQDVLTGMETNNILTDVIQLL